MVFEDRVAKYPGRWTMVKSDGTSEIVTLIRNDEPTKEGTPINAATLNELSTVAGAINAKEEAVSAASSANSAATSAAQSAQSASAYATNAESSAASAEESANRAEAIVSTDKTLSVEGAPADGKATGDAVKNIKFPVATATTLGGVKVGSGLTVDADGRLSADSALAAYPVGSIFETVSHASPASMFGGIWEEIARGRTLMGATDAQIVGNTVEAGLPNINFSFTAAKVGDGSSGDSHGYTCPVSSKFRLDASLSNPIYGASDTVQPPAYIVHIWERMGYLLNIYATPGCTLTITNGETTVEDVVDDFGHYSRELPSTGTWTITASKDGNVFTKTCVVDAYGIYTVEIAIEVFGVVWNYNNSSTVLTRLTKESDPYGFVTVNITSEPVPAVGASNGTSPFDKHMPWKGMEEYNIVNNVVGPKYGEPGFSRTDKDTMVYIPEFYYNVKDDSANSKRYFYISDREIDGFEKHPGSGRYVGRYNTIAGNYSESGAAPYVNMTINVARTGATGKGRKWSLYDYASWCAIQLLYLVEYADWDSQTKIGRGYVDGNSSAISSGKTDTMVYHTGRAAGTDGKTAVQYRHIENAWGNVSDFIDGLNAKGSSVYICTDPSRYASSTADGYIEFTGMPTASAYISGLKYYNDYPWLMLPQTGKGSSSTYIPDTYGYWERDWAYMKNSGSYSHGSEAGLFHFDRGGEVSEKSSKMGARLQFNP